MAAKIKKGDRVIVTTGRDKGKKGEVMKVFPKENRALISGVNVVKRHQRQSQKDQGGIVTKELPVSCRTWPISIPSPASDQDRLEGVGRRAPGTFRQEVR